MVGFLCDGMLGDVARWLRLMGHDAEYVGPTMDDTDVLALASSTKRWLLTRDRILHDRARARGVPATLLASGPLEEALVAALRDSGSTVAEEAWFTRCTRCNGDLVEVAATAVADRVPPAVLEKVGGFMECPRCRQIYWHGSHVAPIQEVLEAVAGRVGTLNSPKSEP